MSDNSRPLDERYFDWLCSLIGSFSNRHPEKSYILLYEQMFKTAFDDSVPNDFNRALDGKDLRYEFIEKFDLTASKEWLELDCSIFEMLIALARRVSYHTDWTPQKSFHMFISNLELVKYHDDKYHDGVFSEPVQFVLDRLNSRTYEYNGRGGLFPLSDPRSDQRGVEIWYQMSAYLLENYTF